MSDEGKKKRTRRGRRGGRRGRRNRRPQKGTGGQASPGWHLKVKELRRQAAKSSPASASKVMRGWELQLGYRPEEEEPWLLIAKPASATPEWKWLNRVADFLGIPKVDEDGESQRPDDRDGLSLVTWTWKGAPPKLLSSDDGGHSHE